MKKNNRIAEGLHGAARRCFVTAATVGGIALAAYASIVIQVTAAPADRLVVPEQGAARLVGWSGEKIQRFLDHRVRSDFARDVIFVEARGAFEHPDDDKFFQPNGQPDHWGMWKGEFWGKLMISACRTAEYAHDEDLKRFLHEEILPGTVPIKFNPGVAVERP